MNAIEENGQFLAYLNIINVHCILHRLEELYAENERMKHVIKVSVESERTHLGRNVLIQLADELGVEYEDL